MQGNDAKAERRRRSGMRLGPVSGFSGGIPSLLQGVGGFDYYVDPSATSNGAGTIASPYTLAQMTALSGSVANKRIGLKRGTTADGTTLNPLLELSDNGVLIDAYGSGVAPILDCSMLISGAWTSLGSNKWRWTGTQVSNTLASGNVFKNGAPMQLVQNSAGLDAAGKALVTAWGWGGTGISATTTFTVDIYSTVDPTSDGNTYRYSRWLYAIHLSGANVTVKNVTVKNPLSQSGGLFCDVALTGVTTLDGVRVEHGSRHNAQVSSSLVATNCYSYGGRNLQEFGNPNAFVFYNSLGITTLTASFTNCTFDGADVPAGNETNCAVIAHDNGSGKLLSLTMNGCTFKGRTDGPSVCAATIGITDAVLTNVRQFLDQAFDTATINITGAVGSLDRLLKSTASTGTLTINTKKCVLTAMLGDISDFVHSLILVDTGATINWNSGSVSDATQADRIAVTGSGADFDLLAYYIAGSMSRYNMIVTGANLDYIDILGQTGGGAVTIASANNTYPSASGAGVRWDINNVAKANIAAMQASGWETGSIAA